MLFYIIKGLLVESKCMTDSLACVLPKSICRETQIFLEIYWVLLLSQLQIEKLLTDKK